MMLKDSSRQYISSLSIIAVALFIGFPMWWKTTEVYRCPLPYNEIQKLSISHVPPELAIRVSIVLLSNSTGDGDMLHMGSLISQLQQELVTGSISARGTRINIRCIPQAHMLNSEVQTVLMSYLQLDSPEDFSSHVSKILPSALGHYYIILIPAHVLPERREGDPHRFEWRDRPVFVTHYRHSFVTVPDQNDILTSLPDVFKVIKSVYGDRKQLEKNLKIVMGSGQDRVDADSMRQLRASQGYQLSFTLLNPDPARVTATWNIQDVTKDILLPFLEHCGISTLGNFSVSSQELYYTDMKFHPKKDKDEFYVSSAQLPPMISSVESKLASHVSQYPSLNFLVYVPKTTESPLFIRQKSDPLTQTDNFLVPQWGGVAFYNAEESSSEADQSNKTTKRGPRKLRVEMRVLMPVFVEQLMMLLGVPDSSMDMQERESRLHFSVGQHGVTDWKVDQLLIGKLIESVSMATTSLVSLVQLLDKVKNMVISDHIQHEVEQSLLSIQECYRHAMSGDLEAAYHLAKQAMKSAEIAFFDPSILELLYFPDDQKLISNIVEFIDGERLIGALRSFPCLFAIYIPLFLPISVPIFFSSLAAFKWLMTLAKGKDVEILRPPTKSIAQTNASLSSHDDEATTGQGGGEGGSGGCGRSDGGGGSGGEEGSGGEGGSGVGEGRNSGGEGGSCGAEGSGGGEERNSGGEGGSGGGEGRNSGGEGGSGCEKSDDGRSDSEREGTNKS